MSDDELSTARQLSDSSSEEEQADVSCRFTNPFTNETYFTKPLKFYREMSVGFLFHIVKSELGDCAFHLKVGKQVWQSEDAYDRFWQSEYVQDELGASEAREIVVQIIKATTLLTD